jgi:hypothetical protein
VNYIAHAVIGTDLFYVDQKGQAQYLGLWSCHRINPTATSYRPAGKSRDQVDAPRAQASLEGAFWMTFAS